MTSYEPVYSVTPLLYLNTLNLFLYVFFLYQKFFINHSQLWATLAFATQYNKPIISRHSRRTNQGYASSHTFSDIQDFIESRKTKDLPPFYPNTFGSSAGLAPIYCVTKAQRNFLATAVSFQEILEPILKTSVIKKTARKTFNLTKEWTKQSLLF